MSWAPRPQIPISDWADRHFVVPVGRHKGPFDSALVPYLREILDACGEGGPTQITLLKSAQSSGSTFSHVAIAYWLARDPSDVLIVYPSEPTARDQLERRVRPVLRACRELSFLPVGQTKFQVNTTVGRVTIGWSGSPASLASHPYRRVVCDEVDKYLAWRGLEADPISLARDRTITYGSRAKVLLISTPTTRQSAIWRAWQESGERRRWHVSCPGCGLLQLFRWPALHWDGQEQLEASGGGEIDADSWRAVAGEVEAGKRKVWWACQGCGRKSEAHLSGQWVTEGLPAGARVGASSVAYHIWAGMSPFVAWSDLVAEYLRSRAAGGGSWQNFVNAFLGEPYEESVAQNDESLFARRGAGRPVGLVPAWARVVIASADPQLSRIWWMVRAWGPGGQSRLLAFGATPDFETLRAKVLAAEWAVEGSHERMLTSFLIIDVGGSTRVGGERVPRGDETLRFAATDPSRIIPIIGLPGRRRTGDPRIKVSASPRGALYGVTVRVADVNYYKDLLAYRIATPNERDPRELWQENESVTPEYANHMTSEERVLKKGQWIWEKRYGRVRNDLWDCATYQCVAADLAQLEAVEDRLGVVDTPEPEPEVGSPEAERFFEEQRAPRWWTGAR